MRMLSGGCRNLYPMARTLFLALLVLCMAAGIAFPVHAADKGSLYGPFSTRVEPGVAQQEVAPESHFNSGELSSRHKPEHLKGRLMIKLAPAAAIAGLSTTSKWVATDDDVLIKVRGVRGFKGMKHHFREAKAPQEGETVRGRDGKLVKKPDLTRWHRVDLDENEDIPTKIEELKKIPGIELVEPDYIRKPAILPSSSSDPLYGQQWHLASVHAPEAWAYLQSQGLPPGGTRDVIVAVIDTGIDLTHPDLAANLWTNSKDGSHGYETITNTNKPTDDNGHGTHVAGIIAAQANNAAGGVGIAYNIQIMAIKAAQYSGVLAASDIAEGIYFAVTNGADVINMSFGGYGKSQIEEDALVTAFGQAVLVAAAGNDGVPNEKACDPYNAKAMYPAAYNWVLGVMASQQTPNSQGGYLAPFSNYDCVVNNTVEYELMAPGVGIWSSLPNNQYAAWSGTSMATPVVSAIAALVRTKFPDKNLYPSRFIMGQIATTGPLQPAYTPPKSDPVYYHSADALAALTTFPKPKLTYLDHWLFDSTALSSVNNANGRIDAGETIDLAVTIRNLWGKAGNVTVKLEATAGVVGPDPYVTMITDTVNYGAVGSFSSNDNGLILDATGAVTGVTNPFRFTVSSSTPNGHVIPFKVTITAANGFDAADTTVYTFSSTFTIGVTNGQELPRIISQNMTLTKDTFWIIPDATLIEAGVTVTIQPGAKVQFYSSEAKKPYATDPLASIMVKGTLNIAGTLAEPVELFLADPYKGRVIDIKQSGVGIVNLLYAKMENPSLLATNVDHSYFGGTGTLTQSAVVNGSTIFFFAMHSLDAKYIKSSRFTSLGYDGMTYLAYDSSNNYNFYLVEKPLYSITESIFEHNYMRAVWCGSCGNTVTDNVILSNSRFSYVNPATWVDSYFYFKSNVDVSKQTTVIANNSFLERYINLTPNKWNGFRYDGWNTGTVSLPFNLSNNYWGTSSTAIIDAMIYDYYDQFDYGKILYQPILASAPVTAYPFVVNVAVADANGQPAAIVGAGTITFTVTFNRDMDQTIQPAVSFGPAVPFTDFTVPGSWQDARTWVGTKTIAPVTGDGNQIIRVAGALAANDPWLVTGDDSGRFQFQIITSGTASMNLQGSGGEGYVDLSWSQNDFDLLGGYHLYRSTTVAGTYTRINATIIPPQTKSYHDINVTPGKPYYYKFTVVKTDLTESAFSNVAVGTPLDTIPPVIVHTPVTSATPGLSLSLSALATDNVAVTGVVLYYRATGGSSFTGVAMVNTTGSSYVATIAGSLMIAPGIEYYLTVTDGISTVNAGRAEYPYQIVVSDLPVITAVTPAKGPIAGGTSVTVAGANFKQGAAVTFGGGIATVTGVTSNQITCVTPAHFPAAVDVIVVNSDGKSGSLLRGFTFESDTASLSLPVVTAIKTAIIQVPVNAANLNGLAAADLTVTFNPAVLTLRTVTTGTLTSGWGNTVNTAIAGQVTLAMASSGSTVTGGGTLLNLEFEVIGTPGSVSALTLTNAKLNGGAIPVSTAAGSVTVQMVYGVGGAIKFWKNSSSIPGVQLQLSGDRAYSGVTDAAGAYVVSGVLPGAYVLRPTKTGDSGGITAFDASLVLKHAAGVALLTGSQAVAADVDKSGVIDSMDAFYILQKAVGLITLPFTGAGVVWEFTPATRSYGALSSTLAAEGFTGILLGDVSGDWTTGAAIQSLSPAVLSVAEAQPAVDRTLTATVSVDPQGTAIYSLDTVLSYDPAQGIPVVVQAGAAAANWSLASNLQKTGEIRVAMAGATQLATGALFTIKFNLNAGAGSVHLRLPTATANEVSALSSSYLLNVAMSGSGTGSVTSVPSGISCGAACSASFADGTSVTLTPTATGSVFKGWSGACSGMGDVGNNACTVAISAAATVTAAFDVAPPTFSTVSPLANSTVGTRYSKAVSVTGGVATYVWGLVSGSLPPGVTLNAATGYLAGIPTSSGVYTFTISVTDSQGVPVTITKEFRLTVSVGTLSIITVSPLAGATAGTRFSKSCDVIGGVAPYSWTLDSGNLPSGVSLNGTTGYLAGIPTASGTYSFAIKVTDGQGTPATATKTFSLAVAVAPPTIVTVSPLTDATKGVAYSKTLSATGGVKPYSWSVAAGSLPSGITLDLLAGKLTGTATTSGTYAVTLRVTDVQGSVATKAFTMTVI